jgi:hypothetical protein
MVCAHDFGDQGVGPQQAIRPAIAKEMGDLWKPTTIPDAQPKPCKETASSGKDSDLIVLNLSPKALKVTPGKEAPVTVAWTPGTRSAATQALSCELILARVLFSGTNRRSPTYRKVTNFRLVGYPSLKITSRLPVIRSECGCALSMILRFGCVQRCGTVWGAFTAEISTNIGRRRSSFHSGHWTSISVVGTGSTSLETWNPEWITVLT